MAYQEEVAAQVRKELSTQPNVEEKKMFGGLAFMVNGKMCVCIGGDDGDIVMLRVGPDAYEASLKKPGAKPSVMNGRIMNGYIEIGPEGQKDLPAWIRLALNFNKTLVGY